ncbi:MAG: hypothetical protein WCQ67_07355 [Treponema sp.]
MAENNVTQWEYETIRNSGISSDETLKKLKQAGEEGWEATGNNVGCSILMKRPKQQKTPTRDEEDLSR